MIPFIPFELCIIQVVSICIDDKYYYHHLKGHNVSVIAANIMKHSHCEHSHYGLRVSGFLRREGGDSVAEMHILV